MNLAPYRTVLGYPRVRGLLVFGVLARVPQTAAGVVLTLYVVVGLHQGYGAAGLVGTVGTVGMALGGPWRGRAVDRVGLRRALAPSLLVGVPSWLVAPLLSYPWLLLDAFVGGLLALPIFGLMRQSLAALVPEEHRRTTYALDSIGVEVSFMIGPAAGVLVATQASPALGLVVVGVSLGLAGIGLMVLDPATTSAQARDGGVHEAEERGHAEGGALADTAVERAGGHAWLPAWLGPELASVLGASVAATLVLAGTDVSIVAALREHGALPMTGLVFVAWGIGSIIGGAVYGALPHRVPAFVLLLGLGLLTIPVGLAPGPWLLTLTILPAAALCAPVITATAESVSRLVPESVRGEALGWHTSSLMVGNAIGAPLAGSVIDASAPWAGFAVVGAAGVVLAVVGLTVEAARRTGRSSPLLVDGT